MVEYQDVVQRLTMLGYTPTDSDRIKIDYELNLILDYVVNYCNFTSNNDIPKILDKRIIDRVCSEYLFKQKNAGQLNGFNYDAVIKTIKEGDTQIQFASENEAETVESRFDKFVDYMNRGFDKWISPHRRIRW